jgi:hypothetical protein
MVGRRGDVAVTVQAMCERRGSAVHLRFAHLRHRPPAWRGLAPRLPGSDPAYGCSNREGGSEREGCGDAAAGGGQQARRCATLDVSPFACTAWGAHGPRSHTRWGGPAQVRTSWRWLWPSCCAAPPPRPSRAHGGRSASSYRRCCCAGPRMTFAAAKRMPICGSSYTRPALKRWRPCPTAYVSWHLSRAAARVRSLAGSGPPPHFGR